ncbi:MAG: hypothetical protein GWQ08_05825 [Verrucomicrobiaceae bacterium]|nr:hypothetical protein [Verrucomicrobiaceae bacterium]
MDGRDLVGPIRVLSDLHLGHSACALKDVREIRPLLEGAGTVIFNGDTAEVRSRGFKQRAAEEQAKLSAMLKELGVRQAVYVTGNHDSRISETHHVDLCEGKVLVTHGDFLFRYVSPWSKKLRHCRPRIDAILEAADSVRLESDFEYRLEITRQCCDVLEVSTSVSPKDLRGFVRYVGAEVWPPTRLLTIISVWLKSPKLMAAALEAYRPDAKAVAFGHVHYPRIWTRQDRLLINLGGFLNMAKAKVLEIDGSMLTVRPVVHRDRECRLGDCEKSLDLEA